MCARLFLVADGRVMSDSRASEEFVWSAQGAHDELRNVSGESPCPYLPGRPMRTEAYQMDGIDGDAYGRLLTQGFRRSGQMIYRPRCRGCGECRSTRIPVESFTQSRSMRRVWRRNADLRVEEGAASPTDQQAGLASEKFALYCRYLDAQHDETMSRTFETFREFLYDSSIDTREFCLFLGERLVGVSIADRWSDGVSSVYMYFDPELSKRSLGTYSILWEIDYCRRNDLPYYYLGYYVAGCRTMEYKSRFRPNELLVAPGRWIRFRES